MRITVNLSARMSARLVTICTRFELTPQEVLYHAPGEIGGMIRTMRKVEAEPAAWRREADGDRVWWLRLPSLDDFRVTRGVKCHAGVSLGDLGGVQLDGSIFEIDIGDEHLAQVNEYVGAATPAETYGYSLWAYASLLTHAIELGGELALVSRKLNKVFFTSTARRAPPDGARPSAESPPRR